MAQLCSIGIRVEERHRQLLLDVLEEIQATTSLVFYVDKFPNGSSAAQSPDKIEPESSGDQQLSETDNIPNGSSVVQVQAHDNIELENLEDQQPSETDTFFKGSSPEQDPDNIEPENSGEQLPSKRTEQLTLQRKNPGEEKIKENKGEEKLKENEGEHKMSPQEIATAIASWLAANKVPRMEFAKYINRSKSHFADMLNHPPLTMPKGAYNGAWTKIQDFLRQTEEQRTYLGNRPGKQKKRKAVKRPSTSTPNSTPAKRTPYQFENWQKVMMDKVFLLCEGKPKAKSVKTLAKTMKLEKRKVDIWFQNHRQRQKTGQYEPGQYSSTSRDEKQAAGN